MATSSSDESSTAPKDFHLSSSLDSGSRLSPSRQRCPLCSSFKKVFYCRDCVHSGDFYSSVSYSERFADKQLKLLQLKGAKKQIEDDCFPLLEKKQKADILHSKIRQSKDRIRIFKLALDEKRHSQSANKQRLSELNSKNTKLSKSLPKYEERVEKLETYVAKKQEDICKSRAHLLRNQEELKKSTKLRIQQLIEYIFPITQIQPKSINSSSEMEVSQNDMVSAIAEAAHTTYIRDRWVYTDNSGELQYSIVAPTLPGSGNYSAYSIWVAQNRDVVPGGTTSSMAVEHNPAYSISAALTYTAQLVNVIAYYLDIRLPYKMIYRRVYKLFFLAPSRGAFVTQTWDKFLRTMRSQIVTAKSESLVAVPIWDLMIHRNLLDFCSSDINEQQFLRRVARLNANVLHLCFSQNVDLTALQASQTLHNILQLLDAQSSELGRYGPVEVDAQMALSLEEQLGQDLQTGEDSDSEGGDVFPYEWEAVPHVQCPEAAAGPMNLQSTQTISTQQGQVNSIAGGLYTSAAASLASLWRGWTGR